jgi:diguanylate cyclase (GGDEF)-like protein
MGPKSFGAKMVVIAAIFMLPITLLIVLLHLQIHSHVEFYEQERLGVSYARALRPLFSELEAQRSIGANSDSGAAISRRVDAAFRNALGSGGAAGERLGVTKTLLTLQAKWGLEGASDGVLDGFVALLDSVSDKSKITFDPTLDGYYIGNIMVNKIPSLIEAVARAGVINRSTEFGRHFTDNDRIALTILSGQIAAAREGIDHDLPIALSTAPYLGSIDRLRRSADDASGAAIEWLDEMMIVAKLPLGDAADWTAHEQRCLDSAFALYDASIAGLDDVLKKRVDTVMRREVTIFAAVFGAIVMAFGLMYLTALSMSRHLADKAALKREIAERTEVEKQLAHAAYHDKLTGISNRAWLMDRMHQIAQTASAGKRPWAILFLDLDRFKVVNDSLGHVVGDIVLVQATRRFEECVRSCDTLARLGGDEFIILIDEVVNLKIVQEMAQRVLRTFDTPFAIADREVFISASIGIALGDNNHDRPEDVLRNADIAMYRAKRWAKVATRCSRRTCSPLPLRGSRSTRTSLALLTVMSFDFSTSRSSHLMMAGSSASRHSCVGSIRCADWSDPITSFALLRKTAQSSRSENGFCARRAVSFAPGASFFRTSICG